MIVDTARTRVTQFLVPEKKHVSQLEAVYLEALLYYKVTQNWHYFDCYFCSDGHMVRADTYECM